MIPTSEMILSQSPQALADAAETISDGGLIAFRTDTFYGLGADPLSRLAIRRIKRLKGREEAKPILLLISDYDKVADFITKPSELFLKIVNQYWPGPLTLVSDARPELSEELTAGSGTIGLRLPDDDDVRSLVRACGGALTATSANLSGGLPARTAKDVETYFPDGIDLIVDGGDVTVMHSSTVLDLSRLEPRLIREGAISRNSLSETLGEAGLELA
ncbi:MAG: L-threonylcarbamoyladenylate synthase [Pyrinomonadaceae bacterium]|nr:L-threonylcarbamoyladenylate synthase [Pyrinomonadaceae bacterium]